MPLVQKTHEKTMQASEQDALLESTVSDHSQSILLHHCKETV